MIKDILRLTFNQTAPAGGDATAPYSVSLNRECTLGEFIDCVLKREEWGYIGIKSRKDIFFGSPKCEYKYDKIVSTEFTDAYLARKVKTVFASGGWTRMDYILTLKPLRRSKLKDE